MKPTISRRRRLLGDFEKQAYVQRQAQSGKTLADFCNDEGLALSSFQGWKKKFAGKPGFVELAAQLPARHVQVEVVLASGNRIVTASNCDPSWLAKLVRSLDVPPC